MKEMGSREIAAFMLLIVLFTIPYAFNRKPKKKGNVMDGREYMKRLRMKWKPIGEELLQTKLILEVYQNEIDAEYRGDNDL